MKKNVLVKKLKILKHRARHFMLAYGLTGLSVGAPMVPSCQNTEISN